MTDKNKKTMIQITSTFLSAVFVLFCFAACGAENETINVRSYSKDAINEVYPANPDNLLHSSNPANANLKLIAKSGLIEIYIDETTYSVAVCETLKNEYWYSMPLIPEEGIAAYDYSASPVCLSIVNGSDTLHLNSQDNAVAYGNVSYESVFSKEEALTNVSAENTSAEKKIIGVQVNYIITPDKETADKEEFNETDIAFLVCLKYFLKDGSLYVNCQHTNITGNKDAVIQDVKLLEFFGASSAALPGDFLLVPDKSGALINTAVEQPEFSEMTFQVYGSNQSAQTTADEKAAAIAAYGIKRGENALAVIIEKGDAVSKIMADRSNGKSGFNKIGASFNITEVKDVEKDDKIVRYTGADSYTKEIELCLRFLSGGNANYSGIAAVCREQLIRDNILSTKILETTEYLPFHLTAAGAVTQNIFDKIPIKSTVKLTTFDQAQDMISRMKSKGINNIFLRYSGALTGGLNQKDVSGAGIMRSLGGKSGFSELNTYMKTQKMELYLDISLLSSKKTLTSNNSKSIVNIYQDKGYTTTANDFFGYIGDENFTQNLRPVSGLDDAVLKTLTRFRNSDLSGFCLNDAGRILYSDYSNNSFNRQSAADTIGEQITALSNGRKIMVDTGNFYAIKNADVIVNIPMPLETGEGADISYQYIPFIQLILHGIADYSGTPVNRAFVRDDSSLQSTNLNFAVLNGQEQKAIKDTMLKYIEYGACPSYEWSYRELDKDSTGIETFYYDDWINQAVDFYLKSNTALADLRGSRMVKHTQLQSGVFCTEYEGSKLIYVNYTYSDVDVGGVTVKARDFIRL